MLRQILLIYFTLLITASHSVEIDFSKWSWCAGVDIEPPREGFYYLATHREVTKLICSIPMLDMASFDGPSPFAHPKAKSYRSWFLNVDNTNEVVGVGQMGSFHLGGDGYYRDVLYATQEFDSADHETIIFYHEESDLTGLYFRSKTGPNSLDRIYILDFNRLNIKEEFYKVEDFLNFYKETTAKHARRYF